MAAINVYREDLEVSQKIARFGLTKDDLIEVAKRAVTAKNDATSLDPINAPGTLAYIYGTRALREILGLRGGWTPDRTDNIESVYNEELDIRIIYQNVDQACRDIQPKAISGKGKASKRLVDDSTPSLFPEHDLQESLQAPNKTVWYLCVSSNEEEISVELSRPREIEDSQFSDFLERIFLMSETVLEIFEDDEAEADDFEIKISRKQ